MKYHFCTYFDHNYLARGLALYNSLREHCDSFSLYVLCLSDLCYDFLTGEKFENIILIRPDEIENCFPDLLTAKGNRSVIEYYFTLTPCLMLYILKNDPEIDIITYLDSDLYFFSSPEPVFNEIGDNSIAIIDHRFTEEFKYKEKYGKYNVGWLSFRNDKNGMDCLTWYMEKCLEWCYDRLEEDRYADQKYLDYFSERFKGVIEISNKGANTAPWNVANYDINLMKDKAVFIDDDRLIFFHVEGWNELFKNFYDTGINQFGAKLTDVLKNYVYLPYFKTLNSLISEYGSRFPACKTAGIRNNIGETRFDFLLKISPGIFNCLAMAKRIFTVWKSGTYIYLDK